MPFRLRKDARTWFSHIADDLKLEFDKYYFCLMAGIAVRRKVEFRVVETTEIIQYFPSEYRPVSRLVVALLVSAELEELGLNMSERDAVYEGISHFIDPTDPSNLSDEGMKLMNRYASGGFEVLTEWFTDKPRGIETFLPLYKKYLNQALQH